MPNGAAAFPQVPPDKIQLYTPDGKYKHFYQAFGRYETEVSAWWIVKFCQERGDWKPFTLDQLEEFYNRTPKNNPKFSLNGLDQHHYVPVDIYGNCYVTVEFVARCYAASPAA